MAVTTYLRGSDAAAAAIDADDRFDPAQVARDLAGLADAQLLAAITDYGRDPRPIGSGEVADYLRGARDRLHRHAANSGRVDAAGTAARIHVLSALTAYITVARSNRADWQSYLADCTDDPRLIADEVEELAAGHGWTDAQRDLTAALLAAWVGWERAQVG